MPEQLRKPESLVGAVPDPESDREMLRELRDHPGKQQARELAGRLLSDEVWRHSRLGELLPGLTLIDAPNFLIRLNERAVNPILKADLATLKALATKAPVEILALPGIGNTLAEEALAVMLSEWATAFLNEGGREQEVRSQLSVDVSGALDPQELQRHLSDAFDEIEGATGFEAFRRRKLDPGESPSQSEVAAALGLKPEQVPHYERAISKKLARQMRGDDSRLSVAIAALKDGVGALAHPADLERILASIDPSGRVMLQNAPQRRALLLLLAGLRASDEWVVDIEIEGIINALLKGATESGPASLDVLDRQLGRLGVRADLRLPWMASRPGYRIVEDKLVRDGDH